MWHQKKLFRIFIQVSRKKDQVANPASQTRSAKPPILCHNPIRVIVAHATRSKLMIGCPYITDLRMFFCGVLREKLYILESLWAVFLKGKSTRTSKYLHLHLNICFNVMVMNVGSNLSRSKGWVLEFGLRLRSRLGLG
jgi:hypothetical protein